MTHTPSPVAPPPPPAPTGSNPVSSSRRRLWLVVAVFVVGLCAIACVAAAAVGGGIRWVQRSSGRQVALTLTPAALVGTEEPGTLSTAVPALEPTPTPTAELVPTPAPAPRGLGAYIADDGNLWLVMADGEVRPVVDTGNLNPDGAPSWSPDGQRLVVADQNDRLHIVDVASGQTTPLTDSVTRPVAWSSDGQKLAFFRASADESNRRWWRLDDEMKVGVVGPGGQPLKTLAVAYEAPGALDAPASYRYGPTALFWLGDDQTLALELAAVWQFEMAARVGSQIRLADTETDAAFHRFADHLSEAQAVSLSPDGRTLAFVAASGEEGKLGIYTIDPLGTRILEHSPFDLSSCDNCFSQWLSDGRGIVFGNRYAHRGCWYQLFQTAVADKRARLLYNTNECQPALEFAVAPDGSGRMVYAENDQASDDIAIKLVASAKSEPVEIARMTGIEHLAWSPDGRWLAFAADGAAEEQKIVVILSPQAGGQPARLAIHPAIHAIKWSPDGQHIAVTEGEAWEPPLTTYLYSLDGELLQTLNSVGLAFRPATSFAKEEE